MPNTTNMRLLKLTAVLFLFSFAFISCDKEVYHEPGEYSGSSTMSGSEEVPAVTTNASGTIRVNYSQRTKTLNYIITWIGLTGTVTGGHIHGVGERGVNAGVLQSFGFGATTPSIGSFTGSLLVDGVKITEELLLSGKYYVNIHTSLNTGGQIRGQLELRRTN